MSGPFIVVDVRGGLIERAVTVRYLPRAVRFAKALWHTCDPETDDVKVLGGKQGDVIYWRPR